MVDVLERELSRLALCIADAREHAANGEVRRGYSALLRGFFRAERAMVLDGWAPTLLGHWRAAIDAYCEEFDPQADEDSPGTDA